MLGIGLGVAALIIVLSVMNGFQKEVRQRMLGVIPHVQVVNSDGSALADTDALIQTLMDQGKPLGVLAASDEVDGQSLIARGEAMRGAMVRGIDPARAPAVSDALSRIPEPVLSQLQPGSFGVILGRELAFVLGVKAGDQVTLIAPGGQVTPAGTLPRIKALRVLGILDTGHYEYDSALALLHKDDAARIYRLEGPTQIQLRLADPMRSREVVRALTQTLGSGYWVRDWTQHNRSWFAAVQIEKRMMFIILTLIVAVAAFNLVSTLVMTVTDKRADIAILRTLGASPSSILAIFMVQGAVVGVVGTLGGLLLGLLVAFNIDVIVPAIENTLNVSFLPRDIYLISQMPSDPQAADIVPVVVVSLVLALLATLYPSWRASQVQPAEALRHE
jgi:lipoprotein-releasing system permease protein